MTPVPYEDWTMITVHNRLLTVKLSVPLEYHLNIEVRDWLDENKIWKWHQNMDWKILEEALGPSTIGWFRIYFKNEKDAILFQLRWS